MARGAETKERIVTAARGLFAEKGYQGATMAQIARRAGITDGAIYRHFGDKQELFMACVGPAIRETIARSLAEASGISDVRLLVRRMVEIRFHMLEEHKDTFCILFTQALQHPELLGLLREVVMTQVRSAQPAMAELKGVKGKKRRPNAAIMGVGLTAAMWAMINFPGGWGVGAEGGGSASREKSLDDLVEFVLYGIAGEPAGGNE